MTLLSDFTSRSVVSTLETFRSFMTDSLSTSSQDSFRPLPVKWSATVAPQMQTPDLSLGRFAIPHPGHDRLALLAAALHRFVRVWHHLDDGSYL